MPSHRRAPRVPSRRAAFARSYAFRLGVAFALVAVVGAAGTALAVNAVFVARFDRYLDQQQAAQLADIGTALSRAYVGHGRWDRTALATVATWGSGISTAPSGPLIVTTTG